MLVNYNYTLLKCDKCQEVQKILPGQKFDKLVLECKCEEAKEEPKRTTRKKGAKDASS